MEINPDRDNFNNITQNSGPENTSGNYNKKLLLLWLSITLIIVIGYYLYRSGGITPNGVIEDSLFTQKISYQFKGIITDTREDNLVLIGDYILNNEKSQLPVGEDIVTVFFDENTTFFRKTEKIISEGKVIKTEFNFVSNDLYNSTEIELETVSLSQFKNDLKGNNLMLIVNTAEDIYKSEAFWATNIEYTVFPK